MINDLATINTAIRLGALFFYPTGTVVRLDWMPKSGMVRFMVRGRLAGFDRSLVLVDADAPSGDYYYCVLEDVKEVLFILPNAPHWTDWPRC